MKTPELEQVPIEASESIRVHHYTCASFQGDHVWHFHPQFEISLILKGTGKRFVGDHIGTFYPEDIVLIAPNIAHCWMSESSDSESEMVVVQFDPSIFGEGFYLLPELVRLKRVMMLSNQALLFRSSDKAETRNLLREIVLSQGLDRITLLLQFFDQIGSGECEKLISDGFINHKISRGSKRLTKVINYVKQHLDREIRQPEIAELVSMTPQSFSRFFKSQTGRTFVSFLNQIRITEACHLLITTDREVLDIALSCGYSSVSHFNKQFQENKQLTPSRYRAYYRMNP